MNNTINSDYIVEKIEHCKSERNTLLIARNIIIISLSSIVFLADISGVIHKNNLVLLAMFLSYFYGGLALSCMTLQISYRITKYTSYMNILEKYESKKLTEEEKSALRIELLSMSETKIFMIFLMNRILYTMPIAVFLGLLYYILEILR